MKLRSKEGIELKISLGRKRTIVEVDETTRILNPESDFTVVESYKSIRTNIMFSLPKTEKGKVIVITSSTPGEGKTTTATNLAITFAQTGAKVILVDCDLRKSRIHRYLKVEKDNGVTNVLCGFSTIEAAVKKNIKENLDMLTAGEIPPNPAELIDSEEFKKMIEALKEQYDYIFIDTPPITVVTDAALAMKMSDGVVVVVRQDVTTFDVLDNTIETINNSGTKIIGIIMLGDIEKKKKYGYYKRGYKYDYKYGYKYYYQYREDDEND